MDKSDQRDFDSHYEYWDKIKGGRMNLEQVFETTYRERASITRGYIYNQINNRDDADDVFQEALKDFWKALKAYRFDASPYTLLQTITRRRIVDYLRVKCRDQDRQYIEAMGKTIQVKVNPLNILIAASQGETKSLLLAIKKTKEKDDGTRLM